MSSCHMQQFASIKNFNSILSYLFEDGSGEEDDWNSDEWNNEWNFNSSENNAVNKEEDNGLIQSCCSAFSPMGDFLCFAHRDKAIFISNSCNPSQEEFDISFKGSLNESIREVITCVLCIPLVSLKKTSHGSRDWTCTLVGFSSGFVRMYSESGGLLISELFHESPVLEFGCRTSDTNFNKAYNGCAEHHDELTVLYADALISMDGFSLFQTLRACRNQLAVATAQGSKNIDPPPLSFKKWVLRGQDKIVSHLSVGIMSPSPFDQMLSASIIDGFNADIKSGSTAMNQLVTGGLTPCVGFYYATEGSTEPFLSHVAIAVASKLKSALFNAASGWLTWGQKSTEDSNKSKPKIKVEVGTGLEIRCGLPDLLRSVNRVVVAPGTNWIAATCDSFGRVLLLDLIKTKALRMWKGYRDAQVGFVQSFDENEDSKKDFSQRDGGARRMALFLVIYAPRRGILEVWSCINGPRVATFNVGKKSKLVYPGFGMFGISQNRQKDDFQARTIQCCLLESDGSMKDLSVPFHLALSDSKSDKARDIQLLKTVSKLLQNNEQVNGEEVTQLITEMRLPSVQLQALKKLLQAKLVSCEMFESCLQKVLDHVQGEDKKESRELVIYADRQISLLKVFAAVGKLNKLGHRFEPLPLPDVRSEDLSEEFMITGRESDRILQLLVDLHSIRPEQPRPENQSLAPSEFVRCFLATDQSSHTLTSDHTLLTLLATYTLHSSLFSRILPSDVIDSVQGNISISNKDFLRLVFECWKQHEDDVLHNLLDSVRCLKRFVELLSDDEEDTREWIRVGVCHPSKNVVSAYLITLACRGVELAKRSNKSCAVETSDEPPTYDEVVHGAKPHADFETLWPELETWNIVTKQFEDCVMINTALCKAAAQISDEKNLSFEFVSVHDLLHNGSGYIPELISRHICELQLEADSLHAVCKSDQVADEGGFLSYLRSTLIPSFPTLLSPDSLHSHCFWHEMLIWSRDPEVVDHLRRAIFHARLIDDTLLLQGIALMAWRTFIAKTFMNLAKLIEKVGKAPKDRLLRKETLMSEKSVPVFCRCCSQILQVIVDSNTEQNLPPTHTEQATGFGDSLTIPVSDDTWMEVQGKESITNMGREQPSPNQTLLHLNMYLSFIMDGVMAFTLRGVKPLTKLFNSTDRNHLSSDLTTSSAAVIRFDVMDADIANYRKLFLFQVVRGAVKKLHSTPDDARVRDECRDWIDTCVHMAAEFHVDYSLVRVKHVCELVKHSLDEMALDNLKTTGNDEQLASQLIVIIGQRLNHILITASPEDGARMMAQMSTSLSSWIKAQNSKDLDKTDVSVETTLILARELPAMLTEEHEQYDLSEFLVEALSVVLNS